jgi:hypothetical protein
VQDVDAAASPTTTVTVSVSLARCGCCHQLDIDGHGLRLAVQDVDAVASPTTKAAATTRSGSVAGPELEHRDRQHELEC